VDIATEILAGFGASYRRHWLQGVRAKLGCMRTTLRHRRDRSDTALAEDWLALLQAGGIDYTLAWRHLADAAEGRRELPLQANCSPTRRPGGLAAALAGALRRRAGAGRRATRAGHAARESPDHPAQPSCRAGPGRRLATRVNLGPFDELLEAMRRPFDDDPALARYAEPAPSGYTEGYRTFCGT
jgi:uncharacterized protein YdiU (UPF0061 family)